MKHTKPPAFTHQIRVTWGDCDPARIAYTARIPVWALEAIEAWWDHYAALDWYALNMDRGIGTPFVHMSIDFRAPITPRHPLECTVHLRRLGNTSISHRVTGEQNGTLCFEGEFVSAFVQSAAFTSCRLPADLDTLIRALPALDAPTKEHRT